MYEEVPVGTNGRVCNYHEVWYKWHSCWRRSWAQTSWECEGNDQRFSIIALTGMKYYFCIVVVFVVVVVVVVVVFVVVVFFLGGCRFFFCFFFVFFFFFVISSYRLGDYRARNAQTECICMYFKCMSNTFLKQALSSARRGELIFWCQMYLWLLNRFIVLFVNNHSMSNSNSVGISFWEFALHLEVL